MSGQIVDIVKESAGVAMTDGLSTLSAGSQRWNETSLGTPIRSIKTKIRTLSPTLEWQLV